MAAEPATKKFTLRCSIAGHEKDVRALSPFNFPPDSFVSGSRDVTAKLWQPNEGDNGFSEGLVFGGHNNFISAICVMPPNDQYPHGVIFTGSTDRMILAYTMDSPEPKFKLPGHEDAVCALFAGKFGTIISGSWDKTARVWHGEKCVMTLQGHTAAVWGVAIIPQSGHMLTGSADKSIKLWRLGNVERTFLGHEDCVRGLAILNPQEFLSCSNDSSIRRWLLNGDCINVFYGHTNYVYSIACLPNGVDFVSCGEDRTLRVWENGTLAQTIAHPAQSVWGVCALPNGDVVTGASDGIVRVFTRNLGLAASAAELAAFEECVATSTIPAQVGDIKTDDLPGPEALNNPGVSDGMQQMIRRDDKVESYLWIAHESRWQKIGVVMFTAGKETYEGREYDFVYDVDLGEGLPILKLPYNTSEDPWVAAHNFLERNQLSQSFLDQVAQFIQQQNADITLGSAPSSGPAAISDAPAGDEDESEFPETPSVVPDYYLGSLTAEELPAHLGLHKAVTDDFLKRRIRWQNLSEYGHKELIAAGYDDEDIRLLILEWLNRFSLMLASPLTNASLVKMNPRSIKFKAVEHQMQSTIVPHKNDIGGKFSEYLIDEIFKVYNRTVDADFEYQLKRVAKASGGQPNQRQLFHGSVFVRDIIENGFDERLTNIGSMFGAGLYFAENSSKSNLYVFGPVGIGCPTHKTVHCYTCPRELLLCDVILGKTFTTTKATGWPHAPPRHDSLSAEPSRRLVYPEFVVYRGDRIFPRWLIRYRIKKP